MGKLTPKQAKFVEEYLLDLNATQAATRAGYSVKTASSQGERLLRNVEVQRAVMEAQEKRSERTKVNADWVLTRLAHEADADLADLYCVDGTVKPVHEWPLIWRQGLVAGVEVESIGAGAGRVTKIKVSDRIKRVELIGRHVDIQAFKDRVEHNVNVSLVDRFRQAEERRRAGE